MEGRLLCIFFREGPGRGQRACLRTCGLAAKRLCGGGTFQLLGCAEDQLGQFLCRAGVPQDQAGARGLAQQLEMAGQAGVFLVGQGRLIGGGPFQKFFRQGIMVMWLEKAIKTSRLTEWSICEKLYELRSAQPEFRGLSFATIAGYGANGAIVHYAPSADHCAELREGSFLLVDSGAQYLGGTTDITRTIPLGEVPGSYRRDYTLVLQAFIRLHAARFPEGCTGKSLDVLSRQVMWGKLSGLQARHRSWCGLLPQRP